MKTKTRLYLRAVSISLALIMLTDICFPSIALALTSGPSSPEFSSFTPVSSSEMVNPFTGDFNYNLPVIEVPGPHGSGYALSLSYNSDPDNIGKHPKQYSRYIDDLETVMKGLTGFEGSLDRQIFDIISKSTSEIVRTEILKGFIASKVGQEYITSGFYSEVAKAFKELGIEYIKVPTGEVRAMGSASGIKMQTYSIKVLKREENKE